MPQQNDRTNQLRQEQYILVYRPFFLASLWGNATAETAFTSYKSPSEKRMLQDVGRIQSSPTAKPAHLKAPQFHLKHSLPLQYTVALLVHPGVKRKSPVQQSKTHHVSRGLVLTMWLH